MQFCGPGDYNINKSDAVNSKILGNQCQTVFGRKAMNVDAREHSNEYIMIGSNVKHVLWDNPLLELLLIQVA